MTPLQKIPLYSFLVYLILSFLIVSGFILIFLGAVSSFSGLIFLFIVLGSFFVFYFLHRKLVDNNLKSFEGLKEKINILDDLIDKKSKVLEYLPLKQKKTSFLVKLSQELIELENPEDILNFLFSAVEKLFSGFTFVSLYEFNKKKYSLELIKSVKKKDIAIKEKQGCEIEKWMMRQNSSILIEDIRKDFRFDSKQIEGFAQRGSLSFLASPLSVGEAFFGIIRIEADKANIFSHDGLRSLSNICDLGAVMLERANLLKRVQRLAITDSLTSLSLRNYFFEKAKSEFNRAKNAGSNLSLIMLDIDDFKKINDTHGHMVGDLVLKKLAKILKQLELSPKITACRYGGEEFMVLAADTNKEESLKIAETIREKVFNSTISYRRNKVKFTVSGGVANHSDDGKDFDKMLKAADKLLYQAKHKGKNKICSIS